MKSTAGQRQRSRAKGHAQQINGPEAYITKRELAARLRKNLSTVNLWIRNRSLPYYKIGRHVRFKWSEVEAQLRRCKVAARSTIQPYQESTL